MAHSARGAATVPTALGQPGSNGFRGHVGTREQRLPTGPLDTRAAGASPRSRRPPSAVPSCRCIKLCCLSGAVVALGPGHVLQGLGCPHGQVVGGRVVALDGRR